MDISFFTTCIPYSLSPAGVISPKRTVLVFILLFNGDALIKKTQIKQRSAIQIHLIFPTPRYYFYTFSAYELKNLLQLLRRSVPANRPICRQRNIKITFNEPVCGKITTKRGKVKLYLCTSKISCTCK